MQIAMVLGLRQILRFRPKFEKRRILRAQEYDLLIKFNFLWVMILDCLPSSYYVL